MTSQFHILRALRLAQKLNINIIGLGSSTPYHFLDKALLRDFLALMYQYKLLLTLYLVGLFIVSIWILLYIQKSGSFSYMTQTFPPYSYYSLFN